MSEKTKPAPVKKPFLTGSAVDRSTPAAALAFFGGLLLIAFLNLLLTTTLAGIGGRVIGVILCVVQLGVYYLIFGYQGLSRGTAAVVRGEIQYRRRQEGKPVSEADRKLCYHPLKGFLIALLGTLPLLILAVMYAVIVRRQTYSVGALPSWVGNMRDRPDLLEPLTAYTTRVPAGFADILRIIIRTELMPLVSAVGSSNFDGLLLLERLSPVLVLLPGAAFGTGYLLGTRSRDQTHTDIREGAKKRQRRELLRKRKAAQQRHPERLN